MDSEFDEVGGFTKNFKLPSWKGLQKNHAQLQHFPGKSLLKFSRRRKFKVIMLNFRMKLPSWRGLQKNHAQLQFTKEFPLF